MARAFGCQSMVDPLRRVLVKRPDDVFGSADPAAWHYTGRPDLAVARKEHARLVALLDAAGAEVVYHDARQEGRADAIFVHDPAVVTDAGAIVLSMGKELRRGEEASLALRFQELRVPVLATLKGKARAEGGDLLWVDHDTLAVGQGFRTNDAGLRQIRTAVKDLGVRTVPVQLPYFCGPEACLHLMSLISLVDHDLAVIYPKLLPTPFWKDLRARGFDFIEVPDGEFDSMGPNVLALAPRRCVVLDGNPVTRSRLEAVGCRVESYEGREVSLKAEGGPTCLTRPFLRER